MISKLPKFAAGRRWYSTNLYIPDSLSPTAKFILGTACGISAASLEVVKLVEKQRDRIESQAFDDAFVKFGKDATAIRDMLERGLAEKIVKKNTEGVLKRFLTWSGILQKKGAGGLYD